MPGSHGRRVREYQSGFRHSPTPWDPSDLPPINTAAAGLGGVAFLLLSLFAEMKMRAWETWDG
jgi:hypothetical protein